MKNGLRSLRASAVERLKPQWRGNESLRRRVAAVTIGVAVLATLIALPEFGLQGIDYEDDRAATLDTVLAAANHTSSQVHATTGGPLREQAESPGALTNDRAAQALAASRLAVGAFEQSLGMAESLGLGRASGEYLASADRFLSEAETRQQLSALGMPVPEQPNRLAYLRAQGEHEAAYQRFLNEVVRINGVIEAEESAAMTRARQLQALAVVIALIGAGGVIAYEWRRVGATFNVERSRAEAAERKAEHRGAIVNLASHELRNPLAIMSLSAQMMLETARASGDTEMELAATDGLAAARRSEAIVAELLDLARLDADRLDLVPRPVSLRSAVEQALELTASHRGPRPVAMAGGLSRSVLADPGRLAIIIRNMVDNAFKYSPDGTPIEILVHDHADGVAIDVIDAGPGVAPEDRERVFHRYERLKATQHIAGIGIGLHLSRELARRMGGELEFRDADRGARLRLVLPEHLAPDERQEVRKSA